MLIDLVARGHLEELVNVVDEGEDDEYGHVDPALALHFGSINWDRRDIFVRERRHNIQPYYPFVQSAAAEEKEFSLIQTCHLHLTF